MRLSSSSSSSKGAPVTSEKSFVRDMLANIRRHVCLTHQHKCKSVDAWLHDCALRNERPLYRLGQQNKKTLFFLNLWVIVSFLSDLTSPPAPLFSRVGINQRSNVALSVAIRSLSAGAACHATNTAHQLSSHKREGDVNQGHKIGRRIYSFTQSQTTMF